MTNISLGILLILNERKEIRGTNELARLLNTRAEDVHTNALLLAKYGMIEMQINSQPRGRGNATIYRDAGVIKVNGHGNN
jgi:predicted transcriptional regulator